MNLEYYRCVLNGLLIFGLLSTGFTKPQSTDDYPNDDDYHFDDENTPSNQENKSTASSLRSTVAPIFIESDYTRQVKPGEDVQLECLTKNMASNNEIVWYKDKTLLTQGSKVLNIRYQLEPINHTLSIPKAQETDSGNYTCSILPQNLILHAKLLVTNQTTTNELSTAEAQSKSSSPNLHRLSSVLSTISCTLLLLKLLSFNCFEQNLLRI